MPLTSNRFAACLAVLGVVALIMVGSVAASGGGPQQGPRAAQAAPPQGGAPAQPVPGGQPGGGRRYGPVPGPVPTGPEREFSPWWKDAAIVKEIGLTADQAAKINKLYERRRAQIQLHVEELEKQTAELNRMLTERIVTPDMVELQAQRLMAPRMIIDTSRIRMLYEMSRVLTPEQNRKLREVFDRMRTQDRDGGRGRGSKQ
jgi:Spy/CpxP family protein refolding chaperone